MMHGQKNIKLCDESVLTLAAYRQATRNSYREWRYHMLLVYNCIILKMSTWGSKHVEEINILWINNSAQKLVINIQSIHDVWSKKHQVVPPLVFFPVPHISNPHTIIIRKNINLILPTTPRSSKWYSSCSFLQPPNVFP